MISFIGCTAGGLAYRGRAGEVSGSVFSRFELQQLRNELEAPKIEIDAFENVLEPLQNDLELLEIELEPLQNILGVLQKELAPQDNVLEPFEIGARKRKYTLSRGST